jgi:hypothetical protein
MLLRQRQIENSGRGLARVLKRLQLVSLGLSFALILGTSQSLVAAATPILPNSSLTPGAINPSVTQANIKSTICVSGYTSTIRPPSSYTTALKKKQLASGYTHMGDMNLSSYEEDHLISLEIGGSPKDPRNLWPEPYASDSGARIKDKVENKLHDLVCSGKISLSTAQNAIASNWWLAYNQYVLGQVVAPASPPAASPSPSATTTAVPVIVPPAQITSIQATGQSSVLEGSTISISLKAKDANGVGVPGKTIKYSDSAKTVSGVAEPTDSNGQTTLTLTLASNVHYLDLFIFTADSYGFGTFNVTLTAPTPVTTPTPIAPISSEPSATQSSRILVTPGSFCAASQAGSQGVSASGVTYTCKTSATDSRLRWRQ